MPHKDLPSNPNLRHLRNQAYDLMQGHKNADQAILQRIREFHPRFRNLTDIEIGEKPFQLSQAQLTIAREYMFESWPKLKASIESQTTSNRDLSYRERIGDPLFSEAVQCIDTGSVQELKRILSKHPSLARQHVYFNASDYFGQPGLLQFVAQNPIRQETMPNAIDIAKTIIDAGATKRDLTETLVLVSTGRIPRENKVQIPLIYLLLKHGAEIPSLIEVLAHGEFEAVEAILSCGGQVTLPVAAGLGQLAEFESLLPSSRVLERHIALAFSAQFGRTTILKRLLDEGEDPNRYNPPGTHAHSTPLHQAVIHQQEEAVKVLLDAGARTDIPDILFQGTAVGWAEYAKLSSMIALLTQPSSPN